MARHPVALVLASLLLSSCARERSPRAAQPAATTEYFALGEEFALSAGALCRVAAARQVLTEPSVPEGASIPAGDLLVARLDLACRDAGERPLEPGRALPDDALVRLTDSLGRELSPSPRTRESEHAPEALVFELDGKADVLQRPRRFDPRSGAPLAALEQGVGTLHLRLNRRHLAVRLREPGRDAALDRWLAHTATTLASRAAHAEPEPARAALVRVQALHDAVLDRFAPRDFTLEGVESRDAELRVTLALRHSPLRDAPDPVLRYTLVLGRRADGELELRALDEPRSAARAVACADELHRHDQRIAQAFREAAAGDTETCNLLGALVPGACPRVDPQLLASSLEVRARCLVLPALGDTRVRVPEDFQLTLRRGKQPSGLDRDPRYVLALYAEGQVVFHGRHWVSATERRDGRTSSEVLAALHARFAALDFFERRGGDWDAEHCSPDDELGNLLTLVAGGRQRMVVDRDGCRGPFTRGELAGLVDAIETAAGLGAWTTPPPAYADRGIQVWTVP
jgi:hypothetical protein